MARASQQAGEHVCQRAWAGDFYALVLLQIWWCDVWILIGQIPFYMICCNGKAFDGCSWDGIFKPEKKIKRQPRESQVDTAIGESVGCMLRLRQSWRDFSEPFRDPCYKWLWIQGFIGKIGSMIGTQFNFYWYQVCGSH